MQGITLRLAMPAEWDRIDSVRQAVAHCVDAVFADETLRESMGMVAAELLENAVKYGRSASPVELVVDESPGRITVRVTNRLPEGQTDANGLTSRIAWLHSFETPLAAYMAALENSYGGDQEGGLGIVRIAHEGRCSLECEVTDNEVKVIARSEVAV